SLRLELDALAAAEVLQPDQKRQQAAVPMADLGAINREPAHRSRCLEIAAGLVGGRQSAFELPVAAQAHPDRFAVRTAKAQPGRLAAHFSPSISASCFFRFSCPAR